jgi:aerobic-type carbon monoxide dehydrogenase small subunit (CoxS/CutS family)
MSAAREIAFTLNGEQRTFTVAPGERLVKLLRRMGLAGTKEGCDEGTCGACTVIVDGRAVMSCITYAFQAHDRDVRTVESLGDFDHPHPMQRALVEEGAVQCGYCTPGILMAAQALFERNPSPSDDDLRTHLDGNLCRCTGYEKIWTALRRVRDAAAASDARVCGQEKDDAP